MPEQILWDRFVSLVSDPIFWFTALIVGVAASVLGNFVTGAIQRICTSMSEAERRRIATRQRAFNEQVNALLNSPTRLLDLKIEMLHRSFVRNAIYLLLFVLATNFAFILEPPASTLLLFILLASGTQIAMRTLQEESYRSRLLKEYERRSEEQGTSLAIPANSASPSVEPITSKVSSPVVNDEQREVGRPSV